jgi:hypothetical protein
MAGALFDVALTEFLSFAERAESVANYHAGIISNVLGARKPLKSSRMNPTSSVGKLLAAAGLCDLARM